MKRYRDKKETYLIAEIGVNHNGSREKAFDLVLLAKESGADAVKFQTFRAKDLARLDTPKVKYQTETTGSSESHYEMLQKLELSDEDHAALIEYCRKIGISFISTPYSVNAVQMLERLGVEEYKIASADIVDIPLLEAIASTGKPTILSLGMANLGEIERAVKCFDKYPSENLVLLHCVSNYPCSDVSLNLNVISTLEHVFPYPVGFSDHSVGNTAACVSIALGASVVEKHFTSDKSLEGPDHRASSEPQEFKSLVQEVRRVEEQLGTPYKTMQTEEAGMASTSRKSLVYSRPVKKGDVFDLGDFTMMRPGGGLTWDDTAHFIGRYARIDCPALTSARVVDVE